MEQHHDTQKACRDIAVDTHGVARLERATPCDTESHHLQRVGLEGQEEAADIAAK